VRLFEIQQADGFFSKLTSTFSGFKRINLVASLQASRGTEKKQRV
jgi:hypothetical protein